ncbi:hypothetical protein AB0M43_36480 [Longispora sp. NPDC051575]|uniref:hypothetical protein n=1 Tax=Longispora sp. NPDC051575 TaxID=3154943 RepID=UPI003415EFD4
MTPWKLAAVAGGLLAVIALWKVFGSARGDYKIAKAAAQHRRKVLHLVVFALVAVLVVPAGVAAIPLFDRGAPSPDLMVVDATVPPRVCDKTNTGGLELRRTSATTVTWTYTTGGREESTGRVDLTILVNRRRAAKATTTNGTLDTVPPGPVTVTVEGFRAGDRVHATCTVPPA